MLALHFLQHRFDTKMPFDLSQNVLRILSFGGSIFHRGSSLSPLSPSPKHHHDFYHGHHHGHHHWYRRMRGSLVLQVRWSHKNASSRKWCMPYSIFNHIHSLLKCVTGHLPVTWPMNARCFQRGSNRWGTRGALGPRCDALGSTCDEHTSFEYLVRLKGMYSCSML